MKILPLAVAIGLLIVAFVSGTLTVQFHPDKIAGIGSWTVAQVSNFSFTESIRAQAFTLERKGEAMLFKDKTHTAEIALKNARADADHLQDLADKTSNANTIAPAAKLLMTSLDNLTQVSKDETVNKLSNLKPEIAKVFQDTDVTLKILESKEVVVEAFSTQLATARSTMEGYIGSIKGQVAGTEIENKPTSTATSTPTPKPTIPIKF